MLITLALLATVALPSPLPLQQRDSIHEGRGRGYGRGQGQGIGDTTFAVASGARLDVNNFGGEIVVHTWNQNNIRVRANHSNRSSVNVSTSVSTVVVRTEGLRGPPSVVDLEITVPTWMGMTLGGTYTDISIDGAGGPVTAESVQGDIDVTGGNGNVELKTVQGGVTLSKTRGRIIVNSVQGNIDIEDASGDLSVETVNGDMTLARIDATNLDVNTVSGDVIYDGSIKTGGTYQLSTHSGDVTVVVPSGSSLCGTVETFNGDFDASFTVDTMRPARHRFNFTIGRTGGCARLEIDTFSGDVKLRRPGEVDIEKHKKGHGQHEDNDNDNDNDRDSDTSASSLRFDPAGVSGYAATYAAKYASHYAAQYAPHFARAYAHLYAHLYAPYAH